MKKQPAKVSYFFKQGYIDLRNTIRDSWKANINSAQDSFEKGSDVGWIKRIFWWGSGIFIILFGSVWFLTLSLLHIFILFIFFLIIYFLFTFTWILDYIYRMKEKIFAACPNPGCYEKSSLPVYHCECGAAHTQLWPSKYGIWKRKCECGRKIPCTFFNGRNKLTAKCPHCGGSMNTEEATPLIIPVVGPPAAGKTTYLLSLISNLTSDAFAEKGYKVHSNINQRLINDSLQKLASGQRLEKTTKEDKKAVDLIISKGSMKYAVYFYDYAGESFDASKNIEQHKFYGYFSAMIFLFDPFAIEQVRSEYYEQFSSYLKGLPYGNANSYDNAMNVDDVIATLTRNLAENYNIMDKTKVKQSLAVVIPKTDVFADKVFTTDKECRHFIAKFGQTSFIEHLIWKFKHVRFFNAVSNGNNSLGVSQPFEWILKREIAKKRVRRFFGNLLMAFFIIIVVGSLALGMFSAYNALSSRILDIMNKPQAVETPVIAPLQPNYYCNANSLNVRSADNKNAAVIGKLIKHQEIYVYSINNGFAKINFNGNIAFVSADYLKPKDASGSTSIHPTQTVSDPNEANKLIGTKFAGYKDRRALQDKLGFWCGNQLFYEEGKFVIERWENQKTQKLWLVLLEKINDNESYIIRDILPFEKKSIGDIGTFQVYNKETKQISDYMMIQVSNKNELVKIYNVDLQNVKIISKNPESYWGEVVVEDSD